MGKKEVAGVLPSKGETARVVTPKGISIGREGRK